MTTLNESMIIISNTVLGYDGTCPRGDTMCIRTAHCLAFMLIKGTTWNKNGKECMQRNYPIYRFETGACQKLRVGKSAIFEIGTIDLQATGAKSASNYVQYILCPFYFTMPSQKFLPRKFCRAAESSRKFSLDGDDHYFNNPAMPFRPSESYSRYQ